MRYHVDVHDNDIQSKDEISYGHNRHKNAAHMGNTPNAAKRNEQGNRCDNAAHHQRIKTEGLVQGTADGVALDGIIREAKSECNKHRKQSCHPLAVETMADVIGRTADKRVT